VGQRRRARECALQMLYQIDQTGSESAEVFDTFWVGQQAAPELREFSERLVQGVIDKRDAVDVRIAECASNWRIERMAVVDRNVLRLAAYELFEARDVPSAVVIDEAIEISKKYGSEKSGSFINGILDAMRRKIDTEDKPPTESKEV